MAHPLITEPWFILWPIPLPLIIGLLYVISTYQRSLVYVMALGLLHGPSPISHPWFIQWHIHLTMNLTQWLTPISHSWVNLWSITLSIILCLFYGPFPHNDPLFI